jgi:hypothetical protein
MVAAEWHGPANMIEAPRTGQVLTTQAPAPGVGWPEEQDIASRPDGLEERLRERSARRATRELSLAA